MSEQLHPPAPAPVQSTRRERGQEGIRQGISKRFRERGGMRYRRNRELIQPVIQPGTPMEVKQSAFSSYVRTPAKPGLSSVTQDVWSFKS